MECLLEKLVGSQKFSIKFTQFYPFNPRIAGHRNMLSISKLCLANTTRPGALKNYQQDRLYSARSEVIVLTDQFSSLAHLSYVPVV